MFFIHFHFVYCKVWWKEEGDRWKITDQKEKKALLQRCLPNVSIFYHKYIYNIFNNAFWLFTAGSLTTEALGSASIIAVTRHGFNLHQRRAGFEKGRSQSWKYLYSFGTAEKHDCLRTVGNCRADLWNQNYTVSSGRHYGTPESLSLSRYQFTQTKLRREIFTSIIKIWLLQGCTTAAETTRSALVKGSEISIWNTKFSPLSPLSSPAPLPFLI